MSLRLPVDSRNTRDWIRKAAGAINELLARTTTLETRTSESITLTPVALPGSPAKGMTVYDIADDKVKTWDGSAWQAHY